MCPSGFCVNSFDECKIKTYKCAVETLALCADGFCREDCSNIHTNGCPSENPYYCPSGKCVKYSTQCIDYRCKLETPYLCNDLRCVETRLKCSLNHSSYLIEEVVSTFKINIVDKTKMSVTV